MSRRKELEPNAEGLFYRNLGYLEKGGQPKFRLGTNRELAEMVNKRLERLWSQVKTVWHPGKQVVSFDGYRHRLAVRDASGTISADDPLTLTERPTWDSLTLAIGKAIADNQNSVTVPKGQTETAADYYLRLADLRKIFDMIDIAAETETSPAATAEICKLRNRADKIATAITDKQTFHSALDAFGEYIKTEQLDPESKTLTAWGHKLIDNLERIKLYCSDCPLSALTMTKLIEMKNFWRSRPIGARKKPMAIETCKQLVKVQDRFLRWLHRSDKFNWRMPDGYSDYRVKIAQTLQERQKIGVEVFTLEELKTLYRYANAFERALILCGLNFGFASAEIATLQKSEIHGDTIKRKRSKTGCYGEWKLWPETQAALAELAAKSPNGYVFTKGNGRTFHELTAGGNHNMGIASAWGRLYTRIEKDIKLRFLPFKFLRKTSGNWLRENFGGEVMAIFHARGKTVASDGLAEVYTNRPFKRVAEATDAFRLALADTLAQPLEHTQAAISIGTIDKIKALTAEGKGVTEVSNTLNVSKATVYSYR